MLSFLKDIRETLSKRFQNKIIFVSCLSVIIFLIVMIVLSYSGLNNLSNYASKDVQSGVVKLNDDFITNYMNETSTTVQLKLQRYKDDQSTLADLFQKYIDNEVEFSKITNDMKTMPFFKDKLAFNGRWYENTSDEPSVLLVEKYFLDKNNNIKPEVQKEIDRSMILDYLMPSIYKYGSDKLWLYFQGSTKASFMRITPWDDIGKKMDAVYPDFTNVELWQAFNPGLVDAWQKQMKNNPDSKNDLSKFSIMKPPSQDGGTGKIIMTMSFPVWSKDRTTFQGSIGVDVELDEIINMISNVKLAKTGFAYIAQSNGNILALNNNGQKTLGLKNATDSTVKSTSGSSFNNMLRYLKNSKYSGVKSITLPKDNNIKQNEIKIGNKEYEIVQKNLSPMQEYSKEKGFYNESWTLGFVIPKDELYSSYNSIKDKIGVTKSNIITQQLIVFFITVLLLIAFIIYSVKKNIKPLEIITDYAADVARGDFNKRLPEQFSKKKDEIGDLSKAIEIITDAFRKENETLEKKIEENNKELQEQYKYILQNEKLASLGNLVAGVAHEINTPLGNGITTLTYLQMINNEYRKKLSEGTMSKKDLEKFIEDINNSLDVMSINLGRSAELVKSFKKIAVEQVSEDRCLFNLKENIDEIIVSLKHEYKNTKHKVINQCQDNININSYPGAFSQILTNFIMNSLIHGFKYKEEGNMCIKAAMDDEKLELIYTDDGNGIPKELLGNIYEPFFTTNRQGGSSGLGLHIVYNIVVQQLKGSICCESSVGNGVRFIIEIPRKNLEK